ncbi:MAG: PBP1A family penicillin-binding protein [Clostridiaceae bacterium]|nr:PBP1A family penicillin-binding protein [Clostridiaceae bacterium]
MSAAKKKRRIGRSIGFVLLTILLVGLTTAAICGMVFAVYINKYVSNDVEIYLDSYRLNLTSFMYYVDPETDKEVELNSLHGLEDRVWVDLEDIPKQLQLAFISVEDNTFYTHNGVNWKRTIGATIKWTGLLDDFTGGGSTITQQLIKNLTDDKDTSVKRKLREIMRALELEKKYEKDDILEMYLNTIYFGQGAYGVHQAAKTYFNKDLKDLTLAECASIAGIVKNPYGYDLKRFPEKNAERRATVLYTMKEYGNISQAQYDQAMAEDVQAYKDTGEEDDSSSYQTYFEDAVISAVKSDLQTKLGYSASMAEQLLYGGGLKIVTTLDPVIQSKMDAVFQDEDNFPGGLGNDGTYPQASMVLMDPYTGQVKALYGGRGEKEGDLVLNRATQTYRSPGSSIKPITVYSPALEYGLVTPITVVDDVPKDFTIRGDGTGWPYNESRTYSGRTTILNGIAKSYNTVAVDLLQQLGVERSFNWATKNLGLTSLVESMSKTLSDGSVKTYSDKDVSPLAMGSLTKGVTVLEMTAAYSAFVNDGQYTTPILYTKVYDADGKLLIDNEPVTTVAMSTKTRDYMIQLLTGVVANGTGRKAAISGMDVGGKTGTTSADNDRWFAGITPYYVGVVWFGFDQPQSLQKFSTNPALELWTRVMTSTLEGYENAKFTLSTEMNKVSYCLDCGRLATDLCSNDIRGSRVATAYVAVEDVPKRNCDCHISVQLCGNAVANSFCPEEGLRTVSLLNYKRAFPSSKVFNVGDQSQCAPYELTEDQIAQGYIKPGPDTYQVCTVHTEPAPEPDNPFWPFWPTDPDDPDDPETGHDPDPDAPGDSDGEENTGEGGQEQPGSGDNPFSDFFHNIFNP